MLLPLLLLLPQPPDFTRPSARVSDKLENSTGLASFFSARSAQLTFACRAKCICMTNGPCSCTLLPSPFPLPSPSSLRFYPALISSTSTKRLSRRFNCRILYVVLFFFFFLILFFPLIFLSMKILQDGKIR